ncbi:MAG: DUF2723 domain-containing protein [Myxococcales bacterium]|nr:DUF2723 domain-containing protein [Myxococcales bacterium]MCB9712970.1 DUF2723 domain-containing protein [Myxococcales bacterium]
MRAPLLVGWLAFALLAWGASPSHFWLDSGEIGAAGLDLGVAHPPGAPGLLPLLRLATLLPLGSLGFRMALVSAALGAVAVGLVVAMLQRRGAGWALSSIMGLWVLSGLTFGRQARVVEIYALAAVLLLVTLWGLDPVVDGERRTGRRLLAVAAATWAAWCFGDLRLALGPLLLVAWIRAWRDRAAWARWAPPVAAMASLVILALPLASVGAPEVDWGDPDTLAAWVDHLAARSIREAYADQILPASASLWWLEAGAFVERLAEDLGAPGMVVAGVGLVLLWRRGPSDELDPDDEGSSTRRVALAMAWLFGVEAFYAIGINPMGGEDRQTGLVLAPLAALVVGEVARRWMRGRRRMRWAVLPLLSAVLVLPPALVGLPDVAVTRSWAPHAWTRGALAQLPPGTLLLTQSDDLAAGTLSASMLEGARPDVISVPAQHLYRPTPEAAAADPRRAAIWEAAHRGHGEAERIEAAIAAHRGPVALESPRTGLFGAVQWRPQAGWVPLGIGGPPSMLERLPPARTPPEEVEHWLVRLPAHEDRQRLAGALSGWARVRARDDGALPLAAATLELVLARVDERHVSAIVALAALADGMGHPAKAIALTRAALELEPGRPAALTNLALYLSRDPATRAEARAVAERAVSLRPWRADGWRRLAQVLESEGDVEGARRASERAAAASDRP